MDFGIFFSVSGAVRPPCEKLPFSVSPCMTPLKLALMVGRWMVTESFDWNSKEAIERLYAFWLGQSKEPCHVEPIREMWNTSCNFSSGNFAMPFQTPSIDCARALEVEASIESAAASRMLRRRMQSCFITWVDLGAKIGIFLEVTLRWPLHGVVICWNWMELYFIIILL